MSHVQKSSFYQSKNEVISTMGFVFYKSSSIFAIIEGFNRWFLLWLKALWRAERSRAIKQSLFQVSEKVVTA